MARFEKHGTTSNRVMSAVYFFSKIYGIFGRKIYALRAIFEILEYRYWLKNRLEIGKVLSNKKRMLEFLIQELNYGRGSGVVIMEFGVAFGETTKVLVEHIKKPITYHGFDTFTGIPQAWRGLPKGAISAGGGCRRLSVTT